ncbi:hypothetical protein CK203_095772 [Vitis vinifera]|uniref:Uncharacterized protein n=1 Tax=Vitis vinifera TaxID=29760 RepID=A0A438BQZ9_VITVI|nr:hypothetical protein CK203_095772 [Vitis vinifera]
MKSEKKNENSAKVDEVKAIITLRGDDRPKQDEIVNEEVKKKDKLLSPPFPKALQSRKVVNNATEIFEVLKQVKVNIPLLDMIKQVPPMPSSLKIYCKSSSLFGVQAIGARELKPTSITLSLADRSIKIPRGMIEDVLVQVDKFYYPVDFIVLDTEPIAREPNHLTFGNMTLELNIFHLCKRHPNQDEDEQEEACLIDTLIEEHVEGIREEEMEKAYEEFEEMNKKKKLRKLMKLPPLIILCNGKQKSLYL